MTPKTNAVILTSYIEADLPMEEFVTGEELLICADGGWDIAVRHGLEPDVVIGDLDSVSAGIPDGVQVIPYDPVKDFTDLQLALDHALSSGAKHARIWGGIGGRLDQTVANLQLLERYSERFVSLILEDGANRAFILPKGAQPFLLPPEKDWYFSVFSLSEECRGVTIRGARYELEGHTLTRDFPLGVSNEFTNEKAAVSYDSGTLLIVMSKK